MVDTEFQAAFAELLPQGSDTDVDHDEHDRFRIYLRVFESGEVRPQLLRCIRLEPDISMATSVLAKMLELGDRSQRADIVAASPPGGRAFVTTRSDELDLLDRITTGAGPPGADNDHVVAASDWFQRRLVDDSQDAAVLSLLASDGRTRRVRSRARSRLDELRD